MTPDKAAELLATYELTGSVSETARQLGYAKSTVSEHLKRAGAVTNHGTNPNGKRSVINWTVQHTDIELLAIAKIKEKMPSATLREANMVYGTADDKRYREEHPESVRGGEGAQVIVPVQIVIKSDSNI